MKLSTSGNLFKRWTVSFNQEQNFFYGIYLLSKVSDFPFCETQKHFGCRLQTVPPNITSCVDSNAKERVQRASFIILKDMYLKLTSLI